MSTESVSAPVALVTGADKGTGLETVRRLAGAGYRVYLMHAWRCLRRATTRGS
jgi:NAD(P)-dependent dehydrogenase (short-subunit alcohol dehydrogenase family)